MNAHHHLTAVTRSDLDDLERSIDLDQEALSLRPPGHPERGISLYSLSIAFAQCHQLTSSLADLDRCVALDEELLELRAPWSGRRFVQNEL